MHSILGVFGGTFDPVHCGHLELARELRTDLALSAVRFIPAGDPPHRGAPVATASHRLAMVELAVAGEPGLEVDAREVRAARRSYTVLTLEELRDEDPARTLALIVGADTFLGLPTWHRWREIFALSHVVVVRRPGVALETALPPELAPEWEKRHVHDAAALNRAHAGAVILQPITAHPISASAIREGLAEGAAGRDAVRGLLPAAVLAYIERNQLYRPHPDAT
jgi:nicotinate-nucleotide adenylyltransferase